MPLRPARPLSRPAPEGRIARRQSSLSAGKALGIGGSVLLTLGLIFGKGLIKYFAHPERYGNAKEVSDASHLAEVGRVAAAEKKWAEAESSYTASLRLNPEEPSAWIGRAIVRIGKGDPQGAIKDCDAANKLQPSDDAWFTRSQANLALKQYDAAIADIDRVIAHSPGEAGAWLWRGKVHEAAGDLGSALQDYRSGAQKTSDGNERAVLEDRAQRVEFLMKNGTPGK